MTTWGSRSSGSPTTSVSGTTDAAPRMSSTSARATCVSAARVAVVCCHASAAASASGTHGVTSARPCSTSARASDQCHRTPSRTTSTPSGGPPHDRASPTRTSQSGGTSSRPSDAIASTTRGMPWAAAASRAAASGWRVPTSPFALCSTATTVPGTARASATRRGRAAPSVDGDLGEQGRVVGRGRAGPARDEDRGVLHRGGHGARPTPAGGIRHPVDGPGQRGRPAGQEAHLGGSHPEAGGDDLAGAVEQGPGPATLGVQAGGVGPAHLDRGTQGVACDGVERAGRRVEQAPRASGRGRRDGSNVRARIVTDHSATLAAPCGQRDKRDGRVAPWASAAQTV